MGKHQRDGLKFRAPFVAAALLIGAAFAATAQTPLRETTRQQIGELLEEKANRTPAQRKLGSELVYAAKMARGERLTRSVATMPMAAEFLPMRRQLVHVNITGDLSDALQAAVRSAGGQVEAVLTQSQMLTVWLPLAACERLAERPDVHTIMPVYPGQASAPQTVIPRNPRQPRTFRQVRPPALFDPFTTAHTAVDLGGVIGHGADMVQALGFTGAGVKIATMSDGVNSLGALQSSGALPANVTVVPGQSGVGDEGTALLEVVYDMAPGAQLFYACGCNAAQMATNINTLVNTYHVDIIVDDIRFNDEPMFQEGPIAEAMANAFSKGVLFFSASGNDGNIDSGTGGEWEGDFTSDGTTYSYNSVTYQLHEFAPGVYGNLMGYYGETPKWINLQWADPWACPTDDYNLFIILPSNGSVAFAGTTTPICNFSHPYQSFVGRATGYEIYIAKSGSSAAVGMHVGSGGGSLNYSSSGAAWGHSAAISAVTVAAISVSTTLTPNVIGGGGIFTGGTANPVEIDSSDGPRALFFDPSGALLNPAAANPLTYAGGGPTFLNKVDLAAADCVHTAVALYNPFCGTSAAAPHAGGIAALIKSADPYITAPHVIAVMKNTALLIATNPTQPNGVAFRTQGAGIAMANRAVAALNQMVTVNSSPSGQSFTISGSNCSAGTYTTPHTLTIMVDAPCTLSMAATISIAPGARYMLTNWSDGPTANSRALAGPVTGGTIMANYTQQYLLTLATAPPAGGSIAAAPPSPGSDGYYNVGTVVAVSATANQNYEFESFSGDLSAGTTPQNVTMNAATQATANFAAPGTPVLLTVSPNHIPQGQTQSLVLTGKNTHFGLSTTLNFGAGTSVVSSAEPSSTTINASLSIDPASPAGVRDVTVTTGAEVVTLHNALTITVPAVLSISKTHTGNFTQGATGTWNIVVGNIAAAGASSGTLSVVDALPTGYTLHSYNGTDWTCTGTTQATCTNSDVVVAGASYPVLHLVTNVPAGSPATVSNSAVATGGGAVSPATSPADIVTVTQVPFSIGATAGSGQSAPIGTAFVTALQATVTDAAAHPIAGVTVTFTAPNSGPSGQFGNSLTALAQTNALGVATAPAFTANATSGGPYNVTAAVAGLGTMANFALTNVPQPFTLETPAVTVSAVAGSGTVLLDVSPAPTNWTAVSNAAWLHVTAGSGSGTANALVQFSYDPNPNLGGRVGTLTIGGKSFAVTQAGTSYVAAATAGNLIQGQGNYGPAGLALDPQGNLYIADYYDNLIQKWTASTQTVSTLIPATAGLSSPNAVALDPQGNLYIADYFNKAIQKWTASTGVLTKIVSTGLTGPYGVAVDGQGTVYIADVDGGALRKWTAAGGLTTLATTGLSQPTAVAVDGQGTVYITDQANNALYRWTAANGLSMLIPGLSDPQAVTVDGQGNLFIADSLSRILKWTAATHQLSAPLTALNGPTGVAVDPLGNLFVSNYGDANVVTVRYAYVGPASVTVTQAAGSNSLLPVLPTATPLAGAFAPLSDQTWLTLGTIANGVIPFSYTSNPGAARTGHITLFGTAIPVTQFSSATNPCELDGGQTGDVFDTKRLINEALGILPAVDDLNHNGIVNIVDVQVVANSALNLGCTAQ